MHERREQVTIDEIALSNMLLIEALVNVLVEKGMIPQEKIPEEIQRLRQIDHSPRQGKS